MWCSIHCWTLTVQCANWWPMLSGSTLHIQHIEDVQRRRTLDLWCSAGGMICWLAVQREVEYKTVLVGWWSTRIQHRMQLNVSFLFNKYECCFWQELFRLLKLKFHNQTPQPFLNTANASAGNNCILIPRPLSAVFLTAFVFSFKGWTFQLLLDHNPWHWKTVVHQMYQRFYRMASISMGCSDSYGGLPTSAYPVVVHATARKDWSTSEDFWANS